MLAQRSQEWHDVRRQHIGASDAPIIMGVGYRTPYQLWREKLGLNEAQACTPAMQRGIDLEPVARKEFEKLTGLMVEPTCAFKEYNGLPLMASLDGITKSGMYAVEIKCPGKVDHAIALSGKVPDKYYPQLQHQLFVTGLNFMYYYSFDGKEGVLIEVERDDAYIARMLQEELSFWAFVKNLDEPPLEDRDFDERNDALWVEAAQRYSAVTAQIDKLSDERDHLKELLVNMAKQPNSRGGGVTLRKLSRRGSIDYSAVPALKDLDLEPYRKAAIDYWRISA